MASEQPPFRIMSNLRTPRLRVLEVCGVKAGRASGKRAKPRESRSSREAGSRGRRQLESSALDLPPAPSRLRGYPSGPLCPLDPGADLRAAVERITIRCTTLDIQLAEGDGRRLFGSDPGHSLDAASAPSTPRDHSGRRKTIRCRATDAG